MKPLPRHASVVLIVCMSVGERGRGGSQHVELHLQFECFSKSRTAPEEGGDLPKTMAANVQHKLNSTIYQFLC